MTGLPLLDSLIIAVLLLAAVGVGGYIVNRMNRDAAMDRADLRTDRQNLTIENAQLKAEVYELRRKVIELEAKIGAAMDEINRLSSVLSSKVE